MQSFKFACKACHEFPRGEVGFQEYEVIRKEGAKHTWKKLKLQQTD